MELVARALAGAAGEATTEFTSAGTHGFTSAPVNDPMAEILHARDIDTTAFRSRPVTRQLIEEADLVLTAEAAHRSFILDETPGAFRKVFTIGQCVEALGHLEPQLRGHEVIEALGSRRGTADPALDVADPYGRGREAAATAAKKIDDLVGVVVDSLTRGGKI